MRVCVCVCVCVCVYVYGGSYTQSSVKLLVKCGQIVNRVGIKEGVPPRGRIMEQQADTGRVTKKAWVLPCC